jgi:TRAP-type C4-dicarboxylate transport system permease small subunit
MHGALNLRNDSRVIAGMAAGAALIAGAIQLLERDWLRGATGLAIAATFGAIAAALPERSQTGKWLAYGFLAVAFVLLGIRLIN